MTKIPRYRIIQKPQILNPFLPIFYVEKRVWFWWEHAGIYSCLADAEQRVMKLKFGVPVKTKTVKVFFDE
jgi:hypothetical protein